MSLLAKLTTCTCLWKRCPPEDCLAEMNAFWRHLDPAEKGPLLAAYHKRRKELEGRK